MFKKLYLFILYTLLISSCTMDSPEWATNKKNEKNEKIKIGFSLSTLNNPFFGQIKNGAISQSKKINNIDLIIIDAQNDPLIQNNNIENLIQQKIDVLIINPVDSDAISSAVQNANKLNIPIIMVDRKATKGKTSTLITSDNVAGGKLAAKYMLDKLGKNAKVVMLEGIPGASATRERGNGFELGAKNNLLIVSKQSANFDRATGLTVTENILQANKNIDAIFAQNDEMALGAIEAIKSINKKILVIGFDGNNDAIKAIKEGKMDATVAQQPFLMGETSILTAQKLINHEQIEPIITIPLKIISKQYN